MKIEPTVLPPTIRRSGKGSSARRASSLLTARSAFNQLSDSDSTETRPSASLHATFVRIPASHRPKGVLGLEFPVPAGVEVVGLVLMAPGSGGGLGPGLDKAPQPFGDAFARSTFGGMYMRLGHELATREEFNWEYKKTHMPTFDVDGSKPVSGLLSRRLNTGTAFGRTCDSRPYDRAQSFLNTTTPMERPRSLGKLGQVTKTAGQRGVVSLMIDWSKIPRGKLRRLDMLESAASDVNAAARWLTARYPGLPLILIGFSFGGPSMWAAIRQLPPDTPIAGAVSIAGSARGGSTFTKLQLDTEGSVKAFAERSCQQHSKCYYATDETDGTCTAPATLFLHGTHDELVALQVAEYLYAHASQPKSLVRINFATHMLNTARDCAYNELKSWIIAAFERWQHLQVESWSYTDQPMLRPPNEYRRAADALLSNDTSVGKPLRQEGFVVKPSKSRRSRACSANHALSGLVGYSGLSSDSEDDLQEKTK